MFQMKLIIIDILNSVDIFNIKYHISDKLNIIHLYKNNKYLLKFAVPLKIFNYIPNSLAYSTIPEIFAAFSFNLQAIKFSSGTSNEGIIL